MKDIMNSQEPETSVYKRVSHTVETISFTLFDMKLERRKKWFYTINTVCN